MKKYYLIKNEETGYYLSAINIGCTAAIKPIMWVSYKARACHFENEEEAQATITFIGAVLDWELEEQLQIIEIID